ncbi:MAG: ThiF family adenylyltransferase [Puia sp.]|nr:ThiF family adenylyltransferase [Puia sp.]
MSHPLINHSPDLQQLQTEGYEIEIRGGYLLVHHVPYVNANRQICYGSLVSTLLLSGNRTQRPDTHIMHWTGSQPCHKDGSKITAIEYVNNRSDFGQGIVSNHSFSNKPRDGYADYYAKMSRYAEIISGPAKSIDPNVTEKTFIRHASVAESVFQYEDTNSCRAGIDNINDKLAGQKVTIIGLGGTGAYILDLLAKTKVAAIHLFDGDPFYQHNAFRSPGAASLAQLSTTPKKVDYYAGIYSNIHKNVIPHPYYLGEGNLPELDPMTFAFISIDKNGARKRIIDHLLKVGIPFLDCGLGVNEESGALLATIRVTAASKEKNDHLSVRVPQHDNDDDLYKSNIQIAELNMINAALAVVRWKQFLGFYHDHINWHQLTFTTNSAHLDTTDFTD